MACLEPYIRKGEDPDEINRLDEMIAEGAFGAVYKGCYTPSGQIVAIKIIQLEEDETFDDLVIEIEVLSQCHHPNVVGYFGCWRKDDELHIAMELCDGGSAADIYSDTESPLAEEEIKLICRDSLKGLAYLHSVGFIHRDIKGANIMVKRDGSVKLIDFGVSGKVSPSAPTRRTFIGTPYWMAPEVIENKISPSPYDVKADVWSLGITLIELAQADPPLSDIHPMKALFQIPYRNPPTLAKPEKWSQEFNDFLAKSLVKKPKERWSIDQLLEHPWLSSCKPQKILSELVEKYLVAKAIRDAEDQQQPMEEATEEEKQAAALLQKVEQSKNLVSIQQQVASLSPAVYSSSTITTTTDSSPSPPPPPPPPEDEEEHSPEPSSVPPPPPPEEEEAEPPPPPPPTLPPPEKLTTIGHSAKTGIIDSSTVLTPLPPPKERAPSVSSPSPDARPKGAKVPTARPRTVHHGTARRTAEIKKNINRKLLRKQLAEIKALAKQHEKEFDMLVSRQNEQKAKMQRMHSDKISADQKKRTREEEYTNKRAVMDRENEAKHQKAEQDALVKQHQASVKAWAREWNAQMKNLQKGFDEKAAQRLKQFKEEEKTREKEDKVEKEKKMREHKKLERKNAHAQQEAYQTLVFKQEQEWMHACAEQALHLRHLEEKNSVVFEQKRTHYQAELSMLKVLHGRQAEALKAETTLHMEALQKEQEFEEEALKQTQQLTREQLSKRFELEVEQQKRQQALEQRDVAKELRMAQKKKKDEFQDKLRDQLKNATDKKQAKAEQKEQKEQFLRGLADEEQKSNSSLKTRMVEEDETLRQNHESQKRALIETQEAALEELRAAHKQAFEEHTLQFRRRAEELLVSQCRQCTDLLNVEQTDMIDTIRNQIFSHWEMRGTQQAQQKDLIRKHAEAVRTLTTQQQAALGNDLNTRHSMQNSFAEKDKKHSIDKNALHRQQEADQDWLKKQQEGMVQRADKTCQEELDKMIQEQKREIQEDADQAQRKLDSLKQVLDAEHSKIHTFVSETLRANTIAEKMIDLPAFTIPVLTDIIPDYCPSQTQSSSPIKPNSAEMPRSASVSSSLRIPCTSPDIMSHSASGVSLPASSEASSTSTHSHSSLPPADVSDDIPAPPPPA